MSAYLELAQKRLHEFMMQHEVSAEEMDRLLGFRPGVVQGVIDNHQSATPYAERIVLDMSDDRVLAGRLHAVRGTEPPAQQAKKYSPEREKLHLEAVDALRKLKNELACTWDEMASTLNTAHVDREFKGSALGVAVAPSSMISEQYARDILQAIAEVEKHDGTEKVDAKASDADQPQNGHASAADEPVGAKDEGPVHLDHDDAETEERLYIPTAAGIEAVLRSMAVRHLEDELGIDIDELRDLKPQIEMLVVARRNHIPARVVVDPVEIR